MCEFPHGEDDATIACRSTAGNVSGHCLYISLLYPVELLHLHGSAATWRHCVNTRVYIAFHCAVEIPKAACALIG
jgi:hypothetical protein